MAFTYIIVIAVKSPHGAHNTEDLLGYKPPVPMLHLFWNKLKPSQVAAPLVWDSMTIESQLKLLQRVNSQWVAAWADWAAVLLVWESPKLDSSAGMLTCQLQRA